MITLSVFYIARDMPYGERPEELYWGTVLIDVLMFPTAYFLLELLMRT
ncbi:hypothetical protein VPHK567_0216 [Vibrio phage K567]|nr:hypothetical protein MYOV011v1_p0408 [Vibrio phage 6E35.1a]